MNDVGQRRSNWGSRDRWKVAESTKKGRQCTMQHMNAVSDLPRGTMENTYPSSFGLQKSPITLSLEELSEF